MSPDGPAPAAQLADQQLDRALEVGQRRLLDAGDPQLAVQPGVDLTVAGPVAPPDLGHEPMALVAEPRAALEGGDLDRGARSAPLGAAGLSARRPACARGGPVGHGADRRGRGRLSRDGGAEQGHLGARRRRSAARTRASRCARSHGARPAPARVRRHRRGGAAPGAAPARSWRRDRAGPDRPARTASSARPVARAACERNGRRSGGRSAASWRRWRRPRPGGAGCRLPRRPC